MDWKTLLAYITETIDQALLLRNSLALLGRLRSEDLEHVLKPVPEHPPRWRIEPVRSRAERWRSVTDRLRLWQEGVRALVLARCSVRHHLRVRLTPGNRWCQRHKLQ
jgi:hypothetical protein